uniref:Uncharacterized protein n=1 Tax=Onchocerca volvulus TaxID=6282 RepID=A0A8R1TQK6_ONCVO
MKSEKNFSSIKYFLHSILCSDSNEAYTYLLLSEKSKFVPSPMEMQNLVKPERKQIVKHSCNEISSTSLPEYFDPPIEQPQRAEIAYYRCQTDQVPRHALSLSFFSLNKTELQQRMYKNMQYSNAMLC